MADLAPVVGFQQGASGPHHPALLHAAGALVAASGCLLYLSPGLIAALALGGRGGVAGWLLRGFAASLVINIVLCAALASVAGGAARGRTFLALQVSCALLAMGWLLWARSRGARLWWPLRRREAVADLVSLTVPPILLLVLLIPKLHWESFNGDGIHAFETARLLLVQPLPFWSPLVEDFASFPGLTSMLFAYPASWLMRAFGEVEAAARLPYLLYIAVVYAGIIQIVRHGSVRSGSAMGRHMPWIGLVVYSAVMAYSATYDPYSADIAMPAAQDTMMMACFLGLVSVFLDGASGWVALFTALTLLSLPGGGLLVALWLVAAWLLIRPRPRRMMAVSAGVLAASIVLGRAAPWALAAFGLPAPGAEYSALALLGRWRFVQWQDWTRLAFMVVPAGIVPALALAFWRKHDPIGRALTLVTLVYFCLFYVQAYVALHHFVPAMLLPLCVFWRRHEALDPARRRAWTAVALVGGAIALAVSLPDSLHPELSRRRVGQTILDRTEGYEAVQPEALHRADILLHLFPYDWDVRVPDQAYGGSPHVWHHYARRSEPLGHGINYVMQPSHDPPPAGMRLVAEEEGVALYIESEEIWKQHLSLSPASPAGSALYTVPREVLFRRAKEGGRHGVIDLKSWLIR